METLSVADESPARVPDSTDRNFNLAWSLPVQRKECE